MLKHRVARRTATFAATWAFVLAFALVPVHTPLGEVFGPASASAACNGFTVFEDANKGGDNWSTCADDPDLTNNTAGLLFGCNGTPLITTSWNDCISSVSANFSGNTQVCLWSNVDYSGNGLKVNPGSVGWWNMPSWINDGISSIEFSTVDCFAAGNQS